MLYTLEHKGWVEKIPGGRKYRCVQRKRRYRVGFATISGQFPFSADVSRGLARAAEEFGIELITLDNCYDAEIALLNARALVESKVDFAIEFQAHERVAPVIAHIFAEANIPCLAIDIPQPGAVFFGADNYQAGLIAGRALGDYARKHWDGKVDKVILLDMPLVGPTPQPRITGACDGIQEVIGPIADTGFIHIDTQGTVEDAYRAVNDVINGLPAGVKVLIATMTDPSAVGAVRAVEEAGRAAHTAVMGHNATIEARMEMRRKKTCLIGSVGYFPEKYGEQIIPLVVNILGGGAVPPAVYIQHVLINRENVDQFYPHDHSHYRQIKKARGRELIASDDHIAPHSTLFMR
jgi:ribose transport system substrate-binding protein